MYKLFLIALGGGAGSLARYLMAGWVQGTGGGGTPIFPSGTFTVNVFGCLAIGVLASLFAGPVVVRDEYRAAILIGVLGGFTTFSAFSYETFQLANTGQLGRAAIYVLLTNITCLAAAWIGYRVTEKLVSA